MNLQHTSAMLRCYGYVDGARSATRALRYAWEKRVLKRATCERRVFDYHMVLDCFDPGISKELAIFAKRELEHRVILTSLLRPGMTVWDLGANIGYYAIMEAKLVGPTGKVYAVEPSPKNRILLERNIARNHLDRVIDVIPGAISNRNGEAIFYLSERSNVHTLHPGTRSASHRESLTGKTIPVRTMDVPTFLTGRRSVDLVRMDIEGHEVEVFGSIAKAVRHHGFRAAICFETHLTTYNNETHSMRDALLELFALGYQATVIASSDERRGVVRSLGYAPSEVVKTDGVERGIYRDVTAEDAISCISERGGVRTVLLERQ
jgi:FkbM family methyltransferase